MKKIFFMSIVASMLIISNSAATENNDTNKSLNQDLNISIDGNITVSDANTSSIDTNTTANLDKPALNIDIKKGEELYKKCTMCHGKKAEMSYLKKIPVLTAVDKEERLSTMKALKNGEINGGKGKFGMGQVMKIQMAKFSDEDMLNVNEYIETLK